MNRHDLIEIEDKLNNEEYVECIICNGNRFIVEIEPMRRLKCVDCLVCYDFGDVRFNVLNSILRELAKKEDIRIRKDLFDILKE